MRKKEQLLWDSMKRNAPDALWLQRFENRVGDGMPDVYVGSSGKWVELKAPTKVPKRETTPLLGSEGLRISQENWHMKNAIMIKAPKSYILIRTSEKELLLISGALARMINKMPLAELRRAKCCEGTWAAIMETLQ